MLTEKGPLDYRSDGHGLFPRPSHSFAGRLLSQRLLPLWMILTQEQPAWTSLGLSSFKSPCELQCLTTLCTVTELIVRIEP
jgi:hypothetical protein